jgi:hypothetical protein
LTWGLYSWARSFLRPRGAVSCISGFMMFEIFWRLECGASDRVAVTRACLCGFDWDGGLSLWGGMMG